MKNWMSDSNACMPVGTYTPSQHAAKEPPKNEKRKPCDGRHMVSAVFALPSGHSFSCFVRPTSCLTDAERIAKAVDAYVVGLDDNGGTMWVSRRDLGRGWS